MWRERSSVRAIKPYDNSYEKIGCDVLIVGAGGAGLRAAIETFDLGAKTLIVCKSLLGKAHTVMAEVESRQPLEMSTRKTAGKFTSPTQS